MHIPYALIIISIFLSEDTFLFGTNENQIFQQIRVVALLILTILGLIYQYIKNRRAPSSRSALPPFFIISSLIALTSLLNSDFRNGYIIAIITNAAAATVVSSIHFRSYISIFRDVIGFLCFGALFVFLFKIFGVAGAILPLEVVNVAGESFRHFFVVGDIAAFDNFRAVSIFREPGVFAIYITVALMSEIFEEHPRAWRCLLYFSTLITTASTTGLVCGILVLFAALQSAGRKGYFFTLPIVVIFFFLATGSESVLTVALSKFEFGSSSYASGLARISSLQIPPLIIAEAPIFGVGLTNFIDLYRYQSSSLIGVTINPESAATNTLLNLTAIYGIPTGLAYLIGLWHSPLSTGRRYLTKFVVFFVFVILASSQELRFSTTFNIFIFYGLVSFLQGTGGDFRLPMLALTSHSALARRAQ